MASHIFILLLTFIGMAVGIQHEEALLFALWFIVFLYSAGNAIEQKLKGSKYDY